MIETDFEDDVEYGVDDESERIKNGFDIVDDLTQNEEINDDDEQLQEENRTSILIRLSPLTIT